MKKGNVTQAIFQKIISGIINSENKVIKGSTPITKPPKQNKSVYDSIIDTMKQETKGENENGK